MQNVRKNRQINILHLYSSVSDFMLEIFATKCVTDDVIDKESTDNVDSHNQELLEIQADVHQDDVQNLKKTVVFSVNLTENYRYSLDFSKCEREMFSSLESFSNSPVVDR